MSTKYHILLFGGTGICGRIFTQAALDAGHTLTLYARNPSKIPAEFATNPNLHIIQGELGDEEGLKKAAACGAEIFVALAGPTLGKREGTVSHPSSGIQRMLLRMPSPLQTPSTYSTPTFSPPAHSNASSSSLLPPSLSPKTRTP
jgi:putative NADH-flavin reductase